MIDDEDDVELPPLVGVDDFDDEDDAKTAARELVEHGIGATIERMVAVDDPDETDIGTETEGDEPVAVRREDGEIFYRLLVLDHEERRALAVLGLAEPEVRPEANPVEPMVRERGPIPWKKIVPIYLLALILVPAAAFYFTYLVASR